MSNSIKSIGFLATGSEIVSGEILNTNGQKMAQLLQSKGVSLGQHVIVDDDETNLADALNYLFKSHQAIIITGGLGPTSDDRTRFVVADFIGERLEFHSSTWEWIEERFSLRNIPITENNRQQALFPKSAKVLPNPLGSADACMIEHQGKWIFMLPGPPNECLPLFNQYVLATLEHSGFMTDEKLFRWRLLGVSESKMEEELECLAKRHNLTFAYRAGYPYLDIKVMLPNSLDNRVIIDGILQLVKPYLVTTEHSNLSTQLKYKLHHYQHKIWLEDDATKGYVLSALTTPSTHKVINVLQADSQIGCHDMVVILSGLTNYWHPEPNQHVTKLHLKIEQDGKLLKGVSCEIFLRGQETLNYALEFTSHKVFEQIK